MPGVGFLASRGRRAALVLGLLVVFLTLGLPRFLQTDSGPAGSNNADATFAKLCREHGGTPTTAPSSGTTAPAQRSCAVRYGRHVYRMDAITPNGFDEDTARFQRQGCDEARREQQGTTGGRRQVFVYHPTSGVCEHRP
jgi:hypothetical protein